MHRKSLIAIAVGSILGAALPTAYAVGQQTQTPAVPSQNGGQQAATTATGTAATTAAGQSDRQFPEADAAKDARDRADIRNQKQDIRTDRKDLQADQKDIRSDQKDIQSDRKDIQSDRKDIQSDRKDIAQDRTDIRADQVTSSTIANNTADNNQKARAALNAQKSWWHFW